MAHNEETNIAATLRAIVEGNADTRPIIKVYANGCTDRTHDIVEQFSQENPCVELIRITTASKPNAWNRAFLDNDNEILIFADADVTPSTGAVKRIVATFEKNPQAEIACCESWPDYRGSNLQQRFTGFMQIPVRQDFLIGHFYGIRKAAFKDHFKRLDLEGLPMGIAGDDAFIDHLVRRDRFILVDSRVLYQPPVLEDYYKYLGRIRWQNEQIQLFHDKRKDAPAIATENGLKKLKQKMALENGLPRLLTGSLATTLRLAFKKLKQRKIEKAYRKLGPVSNDGAWVLSEATRSSSVK
jgi:glycosyltransferase involved in cell wall biosynthesis